MFCSNCGKQINDGAAFCPECGQKVGAQSVNQPNTNQPKPTYQPPATKKQTQVLDKAKEVFGKIKKFRLPRMSVDYSSRAFKFAIIILMAIELGGFIGYILQRIYYDFVNTTYSEKSNILLMAIELGITLLLFGIFAAIAFLPLFKKLRAVYCKRRSNVMAVFWATFIVIKIVFAILSDKSKLYTWFLEPALTTYIVDALLIIAISLYLFKNRPKNILIPIISMMAWWLPTGILNGLSYYKSSIFMATFDYQLGDATLFEAILAWNLKVLSFGVFAIPILVILSVIIRYLFSHKTSKGIIIGLCSFVFAINVLDTVLNSSFSISTIFNYIYRIAYVFLIILFALCFVKTKATESSDEEKTPFKAVAKRRVITGAVSVAISFVLVLGGVIASSAISAAYINKNINQWISFVEVGHNATPEQWDDFTNSIGKSNNLVLTDNFVSYDDYKNYELIKKNYSTMEDIAICYNAYVEDTFDEDLINEYKYISIDESWQNDQLLNYYYELYQEMAPEQNKIYITESIDPENGIMTIKIKNDNVLPVSECSAKISFKLYYVILSSYSSDGEYSNDSITITVEDIPAKGEITKVFPFDPDNYYNRYTSYSRVFLFSSSSEIVSIE